MFIINTLIFLVGGKVYKFVKLCLVADT